MEYAVSEYRKRRANRLAARGIRPEYSPNWDAPQDITAYQKKRKKRLAERGMNPVETFYSPFHSDADGDDDNDNNSGGGGGGGGHGNTRLPFGLCLRFGIEIGADWTPRDAWDALAGKGITPAGAYERLSKGGDPGVPPEGGDEGSTPEPKPEVKKESVNVKTAKGDYKVTGAEIVKGGAGEPDKYALKGRTSALMPEDTLITFSTKSDMLQYLKEQGVEHFIDPETGEVLNPKEMEIPLAKAFSLARYGGAMYGDISGYKDTWARRGSDPWRLYATRIEGTGDGSWGPRRYSRTFRTKEDMLYFLREKGVEEFVDPETKETVNPMKMDLTKRIGSSPEGWGLSGIKVGLRDGMYTLTGVDLAGKSKKIDDFSSLADAKEYATSKLGVKDEDFKLSASLKKREKERVGWMTSDKKEYVEEGGKKYGDLKLEEAWHGFAVSASDERGDRRTWSFPTKAEAMKFLQDQGVERVKDGEEFKNPLEYTVPTPIATVDGRGYTGFKLGMDSYYDRIKLIGEDLDGREKSMYTCGPRESYDDFLKRAADAGVPVDKIKISDGMQEEVDKKKAEDEHRAKIVKEFEEKAVTIGSSRYSDVQLEYDPADDTMRIVGYNRDGDRRSITTWGDMTDMAQYAERWGLDLESMVKDEKTRAAYDKYKELRKHFEEKAVSLPGGKFADPEIKYEYDAYHLYGYDERGRKHKLATAGSYEKLADGLAPFGKKPEDITMSDDAKRSSDKEKKVSELVASGGWYKFSDPKEAYKDIRIEKDAGGSIGWSIIGTDVDGTETAVRVPVDSWDEAVSAMSKYGVDNYRVKIGDKELGMPKNGMHGVILMRKPGGGFSVYAETGGGVSSVVHESENEEEARKWIEDNNIPSDGIKTRGMNPNDDIPRTHTQRSLGNFDTHRMKAIEGSFIDDMTEQEKKEAVDMLTEIFSKGEYRAARGLSHFGDIIDEGYKSQIETGTGGRGAAITRSGRIATSKRMYGHDGSLEDSDYEKMGYLAPADDAEDYDDSGHPFYGPMTLTFKKDRMKDRATYTWGDSLNTRSQLRAAGYAGEHPTIEGFTSLYDIDYMRRALKTYQDYKAGKMGFTEMLKKTKRLGNNSYIEMQFNGPVTVDDISKASWQSKQDLYKSFSHMKSEQRKRVLKTLRDKGVQLIYRDSSGFKDAWDALKEKYEVDFPT